VTDWLKFSMAALATWRVAHLVAYEDGPWNLIARARRRAGNGVLGNLMDCFYCLSLWVAAAITLLVERRPAEWVLTWLALSGAACLLDRIGSKPAIIQGGSEDAVLRSESREGADDGSNASAPRLN
jgi:hypothetical protein